MAPWGNYKFVLMVEGVILGARLQVCVHFWWTPVGPWWLSYIRDSKYFLSFGSFQPKTGTGQTTEVPCVCRSVTFKYLQGCGSARACKYFCSSRPQVLGQHNFQFPQLVAKTVSASWLDLQTARCSGAVGGRYEHPGWPARVTDNLTLGSET